jgi:hypothetical protein
MSLYPIIVRTMVHRGRGGSSGSESKGSKASEESKGSVYSEETVTEINAAMIATDATGTSEVVGSGGGGDGLVSSNHDNAQGEQPVDHICIPIIAVEVTPILQPSREESGVSQLSASPTYSHTSSAASPVFGSTRPVSASSWYHSHPLLSHLLSLLSPVSSLFAPRFPPLSSEAHDRSLPHLATSLTLSNDPFYPMFSPRIFPIPTVILGPNYFLKIEA